MTEPGGASAPSDPGRKNDEVAICWGGDVNLGRRLHYLADDIGLDKVLDIPALKSAALSIVNLECVVSTRGQSGVEKGESGPFHYRARPEMLHILRRAGIDMVAVANNHAGDYGSEALRDQQDWLSAFAIRSAGWGESASEAFQPTYAQAGPYRVALFSVDATQPRFSAGEKTPGIAYLSPARPEKWRETLEAPIREARSRAEIVLIAVHWGRNWASEPDAAQKEIGHLLVDLGVDAVLGASAHVLQGMEIYKGRPIVYDAGNLLFDSTLPERNGGVFRLCVDGQGVYRVDFIPVRVAFGHSHALGAEEGGKVSATFIDSSARLGGNLEPAKDGAATLTLRAPSAEKPGLPVPDDDTRAVSEETISAALAAAKGDNWTVGEVPDDALLAEPLRIGPLRLVGLRCEPRILTGRGMLWVESFWTCDEIPPDHWRLDIRAVSRDGQAAMIWGAGMDHDPCDWMMPTSRWQPHRIYRDYFGLRPPPSERIRTAELEIEIGLVSGARRLKRVRLPQGRGLVQLALPAPAPKYPAPIRPAHAKAAIRLDQRKSIPVHSCQFSFLNIDMGLQRTGVENASLLRAVLFARELGIPPAILTSRYNSRLRHAEAHLRSAGLLPDKAPLHNLYDDIQDANSVDSGKPLASALLRPGVDPALEWKRVPKTGDYRVFNAGGVRSMYVSCHADTGRLGYVNHFHNDVKWRRDVYDYRGFLSCIQLIDEPDSRVVHETYLRPDGTVALVKDFERNANRRVLKHIQLVGRNGQLLKRLESEDDLIRYWLNDYVSRDDRFHIFFVDKSRVLYEPAVDVRDTQAVPQKITVVPIIHALHTKDFRRAGQGAENSNYAAILRDVERPDALVTLTTGQKDDIVNRYGPMPIRAIGHAYDSSVQPGGFEQRDRLRLVYLARYSPEKNHQMAIRAFRQVVDAVPGATLHCYGFGNAGDPTLPALHRLVDELGLRSSVFLNGWAHDTAALYETAGLAIITSQSEAFSLTIMESLCHGCPVVAFDVPYGPQALIGHGRDGYRVPFGDEVAFAGQIIAILRDDALHRALSHHARSKAEHFSSVSMAGQWADLLKMLSIEAGTAGDSPIGN